MGNKVLVTGITGNVGYDVGKGLLKRSVKIKGAVRNPDKARETGLDGVEYVRFDFQDTSTYKEALKDVSKIFLMRPPQIADPKSQVKPFIEEAKKKGVEQIVFLSLMGIEKNPIPPHYKIEKYIRESEIPYTFLRPSFFMQNLNSTHCEDIRDRDDIFIPAGKSKSSFIDTRDIGEVGAIVLTEEEHKNKAYTLTGSEALDYYEVAKIFSEVLGRDIEYSNPSPLKFKKIMLQRGMDKDFVNVMVALYFTTRIGMAKRVTLDLEKLLKRKPTTVKQFIKDHVDCWV